jgi:hypothetical protein
VCRERDQANCRGAASDRRADPEVHQETIASPAGDGLRSRRSLGRPSASTITWLKIRIGSLSRAGSRPSGATAWRVRAEQAERLDEASRSARAARRVHARTIAVG